MKKMLILCSFIFTVNKLFAQTTAGGLSSPSGQYIESARLVIDILQLLKKANTGKASVSKNKGALCNFCLFNSDTTQKIKVTLTPRNIDFADSLVMVIKPKEKECSLEIRCGVYNCRIQTSDDKIISWGDIYINQKEIQVTK